MTGIRYDNILNDNVGGARKMGVCPLLFLLDQIGADLDLTSGELAMLPMDMPSSAPQNPPVMIAQTATATADPDRLRTAGVCFLAPNQSYMYSLENVLDPKAAAQNYLWRFEHRGIPEETPAKITMLETAKHGVVRLVTEADRGTILNSEGGPLKPDAGLYAYLPEPGYLGKDKAVFLVETAGVKVKIVYYLRGVDTGSPGEQSMAIYCKRGYMWKIAATADPTGRLIVDSLQTDTAASTTATATSMLAASSDENGGLSPIIHRLVSRIFRTWRENKMRCATSSLFTT